MIVIGLSNDDIFSLPGCGITGSFVWESIEVVVVFPGAAAVRITLHPATEGPLIELPVVELLPGTRLDNASPDIRECCFNASDEPICCNDPSADQEVRRATFQVVQPTSGGSALLSSPVELDAESIGVVTGQPNDDGTYTVIFKKQGSPAQQVDIATDDVLLAADVLRDLIDLGCDDDTGEHLYLADIEW